MTPRAPRRIGTVTWDGVENLIAEIFDERILPLHRENREAREKDAETLCEVKNTVDAIAVKLAVKDGIYGVWKKIGKWAYGFLLLMIGWYITIALSNHYHLRIPFLSQEPNVVQTPDDATLRSK